MNDLVKNEVPLTAATETEASITPHKAIQVVPNWRNIFFTWSFAFHALSILLTFVDQILPFFSLLEPTMTVQTYAICMFCLNMAGVASRFIKQKKLWAYPVEEPKDGVS